MIDASVRAIVAGTHVTNVIAAFNTKAKEWKKVGELNNARRDHQVMVNQGEFIVVGGEKTKTTERCLFLDGLIQCELVEPVLKDLPYSDFRELMRVPFDYCPQ